MLSLNKQQKVRCSALEDQLVESLVDAMKLTAAADSIISPDAGKGDSLLLALSRSLARARYFFLSLADVIRQGLCDGSGV